MNHNADKRPMNAAEFEAYAASAHADSYTRHAACDPYLSYLASYYSDADRENDPDADSVENFPVFGGGFTAADSYTAYADRDCVCEADTDRCTHADSYTRHADMPPHIAMLADMTIADIINSDAADYDIQNIAARAAAAAQFAISHAAIADTRCREAAVASTYAAANRAAYHASTSADRAKLAADRAAKLSVIAAMLAAVDTERVAYVDAARNAANAAAKAASDAALYSLTAALFADHTAAAE